MSNNRILTKKEELMKTGIYSHCNVSYRFMFAAKSLSRSERLLLDLFCFRMSEGNLIKLGEFEINKIRKWVNEMFEIDYSKSTFQNTISSLKQKFILISYKPTVYHVNPIFFCHLSMDFKQTLDLMAPTEIQKTHFMTQLNIHYPEICQTGEQLESYQDEEGSNIVEEDGLLT